MKHQELRMILKIIRTPTVKKNAAILGETKDRGRFSQEGLLTMF